MYSLQTDVKEMCGPRAWMDTLAGLQSFRVTFTSFTSDNIAHHESSPRLTNSKCTWLKAMPVDCTFLLSGRPWPTRLSDSSAIFDSNFIQVTPGDQRPRNTQKSVGIELRPLVSYKKIP